MTVIGLDSEGRVVLLVVEKSHRSRGITVAEAARLLRRRFHVRDAIVLGAAGDAQLATTAEGFLTVPLVADYARSAARTVPDELLCDELKGQPVHARAGAVLRPPEAARRRGPASESVVAAGAARASIARSRTGGGQGCSRSGRPEHLVDSLLGRHRRADDPGPVEEPGLPERCAGDQLPLPVHGLVGETTADHDEVVVVVLLDDARGTGSPGRSTPATEAARSAARTARRTRPRSGRRRTAGRAPCSAPACRRAGPRCRSRCRR